MMISALLCTKEKIFELIIWCLCCCSKTFPLDGRSVLFQSQTYVWCWFSLLRALKAVMLQVAKRGWIDGQNCVILTGQLHSLILTHRSRTMMLCGEEKLISYVKNKIFRLKRECIFDYYVPIDQTISGHFQLDRNSFGSSSVDWGVTSLL